MDATPHGQVALMIDVENLVRGVEDEDVDFELLFRLTEEYGRVLVANAYADWRMKDVNQYQTELYHLGVELVHVFGRKAGAGLKNAVDVKMAVDAISVISALPHIDVFVIVSGDRDFIHVLKALRRHGKTVVWVSPGRATSDDFAALCDRFVQYEALVKAYEPPPEAAAGTGFSVQSDLEAVRQALKVIVARRPDGIKGASIKPLLRRELASPTFDESIYGFSRLSDLLRHLSDVVKVVAPEGGADLLVLPAGLDSPPSAAPAEAQSVAQRRIRDAGLGFYRYVQDCGRRREILRRLYQAMAERQPFQWCDVEQRFLAEMAESDTPWTVTVLSRYKTMLFQGRCFSFDPNQEAVPQRERLMRLREGLCSPSDLVRLYETSVAYKVVSAAGAEAAVPPAEFAEVLGLPPDSSADLDYCRHLLAAAAAIADDGRRSA